MYPSQRPAVRRKISEATKRRWKKNRTQMLEAIRRGAKTTQLMYGGKQPPHFRKHRKEHPEVYLGRPCTPSTRQKMANASKALWRNPEWRRRQVLARRKPYVLSNGYHLVHCDGHPYADDKQRVEEHRLVIERRINRYLLPHEIVHHKDGNKLNNAAANLELMSRADHIKEHHIGAVRSKQARLHMSIAQRARYKRESILHEKSAHTTSAPHAIRRAPRR